MGEHSIIIPETRVIDRESRSRVVIKARFSNSIKKSNYTCDLRRRRINDESTRCNDERIVIENKEVKSEFVKEKRRKWEDTVKRTKGVVGNVVHASQLERLVLLVLTFLRFERRSTSSSVATTKNKSPLLVSSTCALVSLLVVGLLRPCLAVPTNNAPAVPSSTDPTLARIMLHQRANSVDNVEEEANIESVVEATMNRRRLSVEEPTGEYEDYVEEKEEEEDDDDDYKHPRESGLERRSRLREAELDTIRRSIVEGLGLERIPDPSKANVSQTEYRRAHEEYLTRLHSQASKDDRLRKLYTFHPAERAPVTLVNRTRRSAYSLSENEKQNDTRMQPGTLYFPLEIPDEDALVDHATLRLLVDSSGTSTEEEAEEEESHDISLYRLTTDSRHLVSRQRVLIDKRGPRWIELDATELASLWHDYGVENLGVELHFETSNIGRSSTQPRIVLPALNIFTTKVSMEDNAARKSRRKRRASPEHLMSLHKGRRTECRGDNKKCCRHQMTVIFKDLEGFEFIVQPKSFDAGYCKGRCPPRYNPAHHHALLQSLIWKEDKRKAPRPCCAPSKLDELEILYFDENDPTKLKVSSWKNMKVLECACS